MRPHEKARTAAGGPRRASYQKNLPFHSAALATSRELFSYADAVAAAIPRLPAYLKVSTVRHLLQVLHAGLISTRS